MIDNEAEGKLAGEQEASEGAVVKGVLGKMAPHGPC